MPRRQQDPDLLKRFGNRVRAAREARGLTQQRLSELLHVRASTISQIETGDLSPTLTTIAALARALKVPMADLFQDADEPVADVAAEANVVAEYRAVPEERKVLVLALLRALKP